MKKLVSKIDGKLLHTIFYISDVVKERIDVIDGDNQLQFSASEIVKGKKFRPHYHIPKKIEYTEVTSQEAWVVVKGRIKTTYYDINSKILSNEILNAGDVSITLQGGHTFEVLEEDTILYEFKTGPYLGVELDKNFIKEVHQDIKVDPYLQTK